VFLLLFALIEGFVTAGFVNEAGIEVFASSKRSWVNDLNIRKSLKIVTIKCQKIADLIYVHRRNEPRVVNLLAQNRVFDNQSAPFRIDCRTIRQNGEVSFYQSNVGFCF